MPVEIENADFDQPADIASRKRVAFGLRFWPFGNDQIVRPLTH